MGILSFLGWGCDDATLARLNRSFDDMVRTFVPGMTASHTRATIEYRIRGCGAWHVVIANKTCDLHRGRAPRPDLRLSTSRKIWLAIADGSTTGELMYLQRRLHATGDRNLLMQLPQLFDRENYV